MRHTTIFLGRATLEVEIYDKVKYLAPGEPVSTVQYDGVTYIDVIGGRDAEEIEAHSDGSCIDDYHEYVVIGFEDGGAATFRNSYTDVFKVKGGVAVRKAE